MKNFIFKPLEAKDLDRVMEIERVSFAQNTWEERDVYLERLSFFPEGNLGIWQKEILIGFICSELWIQEKIYDKKRFMLSHKIEDYHSYQGKELYVSSFAIDKNYKGNGLGKLVFQEFIGNMWKNYSLKSSILLVSDEWSGAKKIYSNMDYTVIDKIEDFFKNDFDEKFDGIIMKKEF